MLKQQHRLCSSGATLFISDAHLGCGWRDKEREASLLEFLDYAHSEAEALFILGDLFDFYFEYRSVILKETIRVLSRLAQLTEDGIRVYFMGGNHDWWGRGFLEELGIIEIPCPYATIIDGLKIYIHHGDGIAPGDWKYRVVKRIIRSRFAISSFSLIHPDLARKLVAFFSVSSRRSAEDKSALLPSYEPFVKARLNEGYDIIIMGHIHIPSLEKYNNGIYLNTGDWLRHFSYGILKDGKLELRYWEKQ